MSKERIASQTATADRGKITPRRVFNGVKVRIYAHMSDVVMKKDLTGEPYAPKTNLLVVEADRELVERSMADDTEMRTQRDRCLNYLDNGYHGLLAEVEGAIVGHIWWCDHLLDPAFPHPMLDRFEITLEPDEVWSFDLFLLPDHRGAGSSNDLFGLFRNYLRDADYKRVYGHVVEGNLPAMWIHKVHRYETVKTVESRLFIYRKLMWSGGRIFLRNRRDRGRHRFDYRALYKSARPG